MVSYEVLRIFKKVTSVIKWFTSLNAAYKTYVLWFYYDAFKKAIRFL